MLENGMQKIRKNNNNKIHKITIDKQQHTAISSMSGFLASVLSKEMLMTSVLLWFDWHAVEAGVWRE
jgi:hypothetical protein